MKSESYALNKCLEVNFDKERCGQWFSKIGKFPKEFQLLHFDVNNCEESMAKTNDDSSKKLTIIGDDLLAWSDCLKDAEAYLDKTLDGEELARYFKDEEYSFELIKIVATNLALERGVCPPSYKYALNCKNCGYMPSDFQSDKEFEACPWCHTKFGGSKKHYTTDPEFLEFEASQARLGKHFHTFREIKKLRGAA